MKHIFALLAVFFLHQHSKASDIMAERENNSETWKTFFTTQNFLFSPFAL